MGFWMVVFSLVGVVVEEVSLGLHYALLVWNVDCSGRFRWHVDAFGFHELGIGVWLAVVLLCL